MYLSILNDEDVNLIKDVRKQMKVMHPKGIKQTQRQLQINALKNCIECSNYELLTALREWVDGVYTRPNGFLSKLAIKTFQNTLNNYTKGDLDLALKNLDKRKRLDYLIDNLNKCSNEKLEQIMGLIENEFR